jgi:murein DD-endopeptidase MepM/ murein hydrolase activator NlpD
MIPVFIFLVSLFSSVPSIANADSIRCPPGVGTLTFSHGPVFDRYGDWVIATCYYDSSEETVKEAVDLRYKISGTQDADGPSLYCKGIQDPYRQFSVTHVADAAKRTPYDEVIDLQSLISQVEQQDLAIRCPTNQGGGGEITPEDLQRQGEEMIRKADELNNIIFTVLPAIVVVTAASAVGIKLQKTLKAKKSSKNKIKEKVLYDSYKGIMPIDFDTTKLSGNTPNLLREQEPLGGRPIPPDATILTTVNPVTGQHGISDNQIRSNANNPNVGKFGLVRIVVDPNTKTKKPKRHDGIDILAPRGTDIHPARIGKIIFADINGGYGNTIDIDHGNGVVTRYAHLDSINVQVGQNVNTTDVIGQTGTSGNADGLLEPEHHLHFEVRINGEPRDPMDFLNNLQNTFFKEWKGF